MPLKPWKNFLIVAGAAVVAAGLYFLNEAHKRSVAIAALAKRIAASFTAVPFSAPRACCAETQAFLNPGSDAADAAQNDWSVDVFTGRAIPWSAQAAVLPAAEMDKAVAQGTGAAEHKHKGVALTRFSDNKVLVAELGLSFGFVGNVASATPLISCERCWLKARYGDGPKAPKSFASAPVGAAHAIQAKRSLDPLAFFTRAELKAVAGAFRDLSARAEGFVGFSLADRNAQSFAWFVAHTLAGYGNPGSAAAAGADLDPLPIVESGGGKVAPEVRALAVAFRAKPAAY